jgi:hypothetical protein
MVTRQLKMGEFFGNTDQTLKPNGVDTGEELTYG